ncbi:unnamed protein product [Polarella glacialis]|uniref:NAD-dependent epimerase/dehydratase domain-containing protein n=2 Tax=Polarella glacialis TaxID=89957 RepID=A0A813FI25_POLGL|nr:unnamed protein product [Polarella glacialis]CAE8697058.1 unnamed protein product [Polarella glacialis]|eukprot:CAMPEP_0115123560 /NCGR_PEP_ID=MMETSP0227-20121206/47619_1 /TAXON_ID=89957 /ORGANISM="Polarella glacialis, Strain CCMP 1383" /LENGTH=363 /DNA_ID=CAMNT_0002525963 /DNA_START=64 /DNA_END=1155 /DNA_ORIENTATION=-
MASAKAPLVAVTGASGFVGSHIVNELLQRGYRVRAALRDPNNEEKVGHLKAMALAPTCRGSLELVSGDLLAPGSYDAAFAGADAVIHTAAVVEIMSVSDPQKEIVDPAVLGTQNVLNSIDKVGTVKTLVYTSTILAVQSFNQDEGHTFNEADWNDWSTIENGDPYGFAKTQAEKLLQSHAQGKPYSVRVINPGVILGPVFCKAHTKASTVLVRELLFRNPMANYLSSFVDVRDVAKAHVEALERPGAAGKRFLVVSDSPCMCTTDLGPIAEAGCPEYVTQATPKYSSFVFSCLGALSRLPLLGPLVMSEFQRRACQTQVNFSNSLAKEVLGLQFRPLEETVRDSARSMVEGGYVKAKLKQSAP